MAEISYHRRVQSDLNGALRFYRNISDALAEDFFAEFSAGILAIKENPKRFHFDQSGLRRFNLRRFPYHLLYDERGELVRVWVLRHDRRQPRFGTKRF